MSSKKRKAPSTDDKEEEGGSSTKRVVATLSDEKQGELLEFVSKQSHPTNAQGCKLVPTSGRFSTNAKGYVQIKVRNVKDANDHSNSNAKVQLHQLVAWNHSIPAKQEAFRQAILEAKLEISHLCHEKRCSQEDHLCAESSADNKSRWGCAVVIFINDVIHPCCKHEPRCIPNEEAVRTALRYVV